MKKTAQLDPNAAFPDSRRKPASSELSALPGRAYARLDKALAQIRLAHPELTVEWSYSPRVGWHQIYLRKKRRILYLVPARNDFRVSMLVGDKAIADAGNGPAGGKIRALLAGAKRWPEGTSFSFDRRTLDPGVLSALVEGKIAH